MRIINEADWKILRQLEPLAKDRLCHRILTEIQRLATDPGKSNHERYLAVFQLLEQRDKEPADTFDNLKRSTAFQRLAFMQALELLSEEEMARFGPETRAVVALFAGD